MTWGNHHSIALLQGYLAACSCGSSKFSDVLNDAKFRTFWPSVKIRGGVGEITYTNCWSFTYNRTSKMHLMAIHCKAAEHNGLITKKRKKKFPGENLRPSRLTSSRLISMTDTLCSVRQCSFLFFIPNNWLPWQCIMARHKCYNCHYRCRCQNIVKLNFNSLYINLPKESKTNRSMVCSSALTLNSLYVDGLWTHQHNASVYVSSC